jgi:ribosome biogenesis GTPase
VTLDAASDPPRVGTVLERSTVLRRNVAGGTSGEQLIAANLDVVFVVTALAEAEKLEGRALNPRRIERFIAAIEDGGALPVVLLNKLDLSERGQLRLEETRRRFKNVEVVALSALTGQGLSELESHLQPGESVALLGLSGVGKSTLVNRLIGVPLQDTGDTRAADAKGKHTTTRRQMLPTPSGALLIDTPGMREFALLSEGEAPAGFDDVQRLAQDCRFSDCQHEREPGCAVLNAIDAGKLEADRLRSYQALLRENMRRQARHDAYARHLQNRESRKFARVVQEAMRRKRR